MKIDGHCHCGEITFEAEVDSDALNICHCTDCQTLSGSAFRVNIPAPAEHFVLAERHTQELITTAESNLCSARPPFLGRRHRSERTHPMQRRPPPALSLR
jgi:hypothetical protein